MSKMNFFPLGGQDEKGKNCYILEDEHNIFMIDVGVKNPIISKLGIDTIIPNFNYIKTHANIFRGVFISSGHDGSLAALPWLLQQVNNVKIYTSRFIAKIVKERLIKYKIPNNSYQIIIIQDEIEIAGLNIQTFNLASSMPDTIGFNFHTPQGDIIYMANFVLNKLVDYCGFTDLNKIKDTVSDKGLLFLAMESGSANYHGYANDKAIIRPLIEEKIKTFDKNSRIILVAYDESMSTLQEVLQLSMDYNRTVALYGRSFATSLREWKSIYPEMSLPKILNYQDMDKVDNAMILVTGTGARLYQRLDKIAEGKDLFLKLKNTDLVMVIAPPINGHEKFASRAEDKVAEITTHLIDIPRENFYDAKPADQDILKTLEILKPKYFFPIRGLYCYLSTAEKLARKTGMMGDKIVILQNAKKAIFQNSELISQKEIVKDTTEIIIDGLGIGDIAPSVISEREILSRDGLVILTIILDRKTHKLRSNISIQTQGVVSSINMSTYIEFIRDRIQNVLDLAIVPNESETDKPHKWEFREVQYSIRKACQSGTRKQLSKMPIIMVNLFEI